MIGGERIDDEVIREKMFSISDSYDKIGVMKQNELSSKYYFFFFDYK